MEEALQFIRNLKIYNEKVVLACSYGPDSMVLLDLLFKEDIDIVVAHVNHKFRKESDDEFTALRKYCNEKNIVFEGIEINDLPKGNTESNARNFRYDFFDKIIRKYRAKYLFTAHHGDDLIETVLMRLIRGSSFKGYAGFKKKLKQNNYWIVRPLVYLTKEEIINYAHENNIKYAIDCSNLEDGYTRNRLRHYIVPELKKENKNVHKKFLKFNEMINEYESYFYNETINLCEKCYTNNTLDINEFSLLHSLFQKRVINYILLDIYGSDITLIDDKHTQMILNLIYYNKQNSYIILPNNLKVAKFYNMIIFNYHERNSNSYDYILKKEVNTPFGKIISVDQSEILKSNNIIRLYSGEIDLPIHVRSRKTGDVMYVKNLAGSKKVKEILIDFKVPKNERNQYPIVVDNNDQVLWIPGVKKSKNDKQINDIYDIILKYVEEGKNE